MKLTNPLVLLLAFIAAPAFAQERIEIFTESPVHIDSVLGIEIVHFDLSEPTRIKNNVAPSLPADEKLAMVHAKQFFESEEGIVFKAAMRDAYRGRQKMLQYQLTKIPAIVFDDGKYVIYGSTNVERAIALYRNYRRGIQK